jgi:hypothetical protein
MLIIPTVKSGYQKYAKRKPRRTPKNPSLTGIARLGLDFFLTKIQNIKFGQHRGIFATGFKRENLSEC